MEKRNKAIFLVALLAIVALLFFGANNSKFDLSALENWGGKIRMVGAVCVGDNLLGDDDGNIWKVDTKLDEDEYYLLWIDSNGTQGIEDDNILKIWQEIA